MQMSQSAKLNLVERALWEGVEKRPDNQVIADDQLVMQIAPRAPAFLNGIYRCNLDDDIAEQRILETIKTFRNENLPFRWKISPSSRPTGLPALLLKHGLHHKETLFGLIAEPSALTIPINPNVHIESLNSDTLEDWLTVQQTAWNVPPPGIAHLREKRKEALANNDRTYLNFIAYVENQPVASAAVRFFTHYAFLMGAAVKTDYSGQGVYRSLLSHRLNIIQTKGLPAVIHCLEHTSAPICMKLGFEKICEIQSFETSH